MSFFDVTMSLCEGFGQNLLVFSLTLIMAIPLGLIITLGSMTRFKPLQWLTKVFIWVIRGTPLMLQLFVVLYVPGLVFKIPMRSRMTAVLIAFVINYAAYFSEIFRGGIESIPKGQYEAGQVLGMTRVQIFFKIVLFQVIKHIVPPMSNEIITLVKDTSLARIVAISEVIMQAEIFTTKGYIWPLFYTGVYFLVFNGILTVLLGQLEKKMNFYHS